MALVRLQKRRQCSSHVRRRQRQRLLPPLLRAQAGGRRGKAQRSADTPDPVPLRALPRPAVNSAGSATARAPVGCSIGRTRWWEWQ